MLSKKMTVSLMSLITIIALVFAVTPAMAEFGVSLAVDPDAGDVSSADGVQIRSTQSVKIYVKFDKVVATGTGIKFDLSDFDLVAYNTYGGVETAPTLSALTASTPADGKNFSFTVDAPGSMVSRVLVRIPKHSVEVADPRADLNDDGTRKADGKSAEASVVLHYVEADAGSPRVYAIQRAGLDVPVTDPTVKVVITLSEQPKAFTKDHISVSNATAADPVATPPRPVDAGVVARLEATYAETAGAVVKPSRTDGEEGYHEDYTVEDDEIVDTDGTTVLTAPPIPTNIDSDTDGEIGPEPAITDAGITNLDQLEFQKELYAANVAAYNESAQAYNDAQAAAQAEADAAYEAALSAYTDALIEYYATHTDALAIPADDLRQLPATGRDMKIYPYVVTLTPKYENKNDIVVKVKAFEDMVIPISMKYTPPRTEAQYREGIDRRTIKVGKEVLADETAGAKFYLPKETRIPASGFTVFAKDIAGSGIKDNPENDKDEPKSSARTPAQLLYNLVALGDLPNLETFLNNGGTIDLVGDGLYISEVMWGSDASLDPNSKSQWIEIANKGATSILTGDKTHKLVFYGLNETLPAASTVADRVGTTGVGGTWSTAGKGQSGRTGTGEAGPEIVAVVPTQELVSMQRVMDAAGAPADGTLASSWVQSTDAGINFDLNAVGVRIGTPGAPSDAGAHTPAPTPKVETPPTPPTPVAEAGDIVISEIMVDTGDGRLPQWIELTNVSGAEKSLADWSLTIENSDADADVIGATVNIDLSDHTLGVGGGMDAGGTMGKSLLLVGGNARSSDNLTGSDRVVDISSDLGERGRYAFISTMAFEASLIPPQETGVLTPGDTAGNLNAAEAWEIPMSENGRSSLIRRELLDDGTATVGTAKNGWILASATPLVTGPATWYGSDEDAGTPGYDSGGPLPVELSHFRPARDKATGQVVITWATQSELNNAGFFIKRSQQRNGEFKVINATMIAGAGTTSEKQFYTYTDTTAQPNVVYYYQIEDVSLDGNRQTLTLGTRLKGHVGAAGKLTSTWGELKSSNE